MKGVTQKGLSTMKIKLALAAAALLVSLSGAQASFVSPATVLDTAAVSSAVEPVQYRRYGYDRRYGYGRRCRVTRRRDCRINRRGVRVCTVTTRRRCY